MDQHSLEMLKSLRSVVEAGEEGPLVRDEDPKKKRTCPPGFRFDGQHCVPLKPNSKDSKPLKPGSKEAEPNGPPPSRRGDDDDFPHTRDHDKKQQEKDIPLVPDPEHEVMQQPHNAITYANGKRSFEYAEEEWKEYAHNSFIQVKFPDAFKDKGEFINEFLHGEHTQWEDWTQLQNCSAADQSKGDYRKLLDTLWNFKGGEWSQKTGADKASEKEEFKNYLDSLIEKAQDEDDETTPPIIIGVHKDPTTGKETHWLISGNTRAVIYAFLGCPAPARLVPLRGRMLPDPTDDEQQNLLWPAEQSSEDDDEVEQNVRAAVQQVIQARGAPPQESAAIRTLKAVFLEENPPRPFDRPKRKYPSGHQKRLFRKAYQELGYPVGTVRIWKSGKVVKTPEGWKDVPSGVPAPGAAAPVPSAAHDTPSPSKPLPKPFPTPKVDPSLPSDKQDAKVYSPPADIFPEEGHWIDYIPGFPRETTDRHYHGWKKPKQYRQKLHDHILSRYFDKVPAPTPEDLKTKKPVAVMLMGGPASGKSTIGDAYPDDQFVHLDADALKEHIPEYKVALKWRAKNAAKMAHEESIHLMQQLREKTIAAKKNLVMDGTGRHLDSYLNMIKKLKNAGYHVKVVMADLDEATAVQRAKKRGKTSGRWVPEHVFSDSYRTVPKHFDHIAKEADEFELWDTRKEGDPVLKWEKTEGKETVHDPDFVNKFKKQHSTPMHKLLPPSKGSPSASKSRSDLVQMPDGTWVSLKRIFSS